MAATTSVMLIGFTNVNRNRQQTKQQIVVVGLFYIFYFFIFYLFLQTDINKMQPNIFIVVLKLKKTLRNHIKKQ